MDKVRGVGTFPVICRLATALGWVEEGCAELVCAALVCAGASEAMDSKVARRIVAIRASIFLTSSRGSGRWSGPDSKRRLPSQIRMFGERRFAADIGGWERIHVSIQKTDINRSTVPGNGVIVSRINRAGPRKDRAVETRAI